jgi:hypothetical protein
MGWKMNISRVMDGVNSTGKSKKFASNLQSETMEDLENVEGAGSATGRKTVSIVWTANRGIELNIGIDTCKQ